MCLQCSSISKMKSKDTYTVVAEYDIGQVIEHALFGYRGVIFDVDAKFMGSDEWYSLMAPTQPSKEQPWYHVLVHEASYTTYIPECNLKTTSFSSINHPNLFHIFRSEMKDGHYRLLKRRN